MAAGKGSPPALSPACAPWEPCQLQREWGHSQVMCAVGRLVHAVTLLQKLEEFLHGDAGVWRAPQGEDLPEKDPKGPAGGEHRTVSLPP